MPERRGRLSGGARHGELAAEPQLKPAPLVFLLALLLACKQPAPPPMVVVDAVPAPTGPAPGDALPLDPAVRQGRLGNGLRYFVRANATPADRVQLRLVLDVGSLVEDDDQRGAAQLIEHLVHQQLASALPGAVLHPGGRASFEETWLGFEVGSDEAGLEQALAAVHTWACCGRVDDAAIEQARTLVLQQAQRQGGPSQRYWERMAPAIYPGAPHPERLPIPDEASLRALTPDAVRRFHEAWYRPDRMTVVAVGPVDPVALETRLQALFSDLESPAQGPARPSFPLESEHERAVVIGVDPEAPGASLTWLARRTETVPATFGQLRAERVEQLAITILEERLGELGLQPDAGFLRASVERSRLGRDQVGVGLQVGFDSGAALAALEAVWTEVRRLELHGATASELERARAVVLERIRRERVDPASRASATLADALVAHALSGAPVLDPTDGADLERRWIERITLAEVNGRYGSLLRSGAEVIGLVDTTEGGLPTAQQVEATLARVDASEPAPRPEVPALRSLVEDPPPPGTIEAVDRRFEALGFVGITFANGIQVWAKQTDLAADEIRMQGVVAGGWAGLDAGGVVAARAIPRVFAFSGLGDHDAEAVRRFFADRRASLAVQLGSDRLELSGTTSPRDLEAQLQRLSLLVREPRFDETGLDAARHRWLAELRQRSDSPTARFEDAWTALLWPDAPLRAVTSAAAVEALDPDRTREVWQQATNGLGRARFVFVGDLPPDFESQVARWIGSLPGPREGLPLAALPARAGGPLQATLTTPRAERATLRVEIGGPIERPGPVERRWIEVTGELLAAELSEAVPDAAPVRVTTGWEALPRASFQLRVQLECEPDRIDAVEDAVWSTLERVARDGVEAARLETTIARARKRQEEQMQSNGFWVSHLVAALEHGEDPRWVRSVQEHDASLTPAIVAGIVASALDPERRATLKMLPEG